MSRSFTLFLLAAAFLQPHALLAEGMSSAPGPQQPSVLVLPVTALGDVPKDLAVQVTALLTQQLGTVSGMRVLGYREMESVVTTEQARQVLGCDSASCMAEIAGALNTDESVSGSLGMLGDQMLLTLSRIRARDAQVLGRAVERFFPGRAQALVDAVGRGARKLYPPVVNADEGKGGGSSVARRLALGVPGAGLLAVSVGALLGSLAAAAGALGLVAVDAAQGGTATRHAATRAQGLLANGLSAAALALLGFSAVVGLGAVLLLGASAWPG